MGNVRSSFGRESIYSSTYHPLGFVNGGVASCSIFGQVKDFLSTARLPSLAQSHVFLQIPIVLPAEFLILLILIKQATTEQGSSKSGGLRVASGDKYGNHQHHPGPADL
jgi:hypothetical protein